MAGGNEVNLNECKVNSLSLFFLDSFAQLLFFS